MDNAGKGRRRNEEDDCLSEPRHTDGWLETIYDEYGESLYRYAVMILFDPAAAEDVLQQVFLKILQRGNGLMKIDALETYLRRAVRNECYRIWQHRKRHQRRLASAVDILESVPGRDWDEQEKQALQQALGELSPEQREVIQLKVYENNTFERIAALLEVPLQTVASRYRYAVEKLRKLLVCTLDCEDRDHD